VGWQGVDGFASVDRVLELDQTPIGKMPCSCPATYIGTVDGQFEKLIFTAE
jgi:excinuclease ABC subunit A